MQAAGCGWGMEAPEVVTTPRRGGGDDTPTPPPAILKTLQKPFWGGWHERTSSDS